MTAPPRGIGWIFDTAELDVKKGFGFRFGPWKYVQGSISCSGPTANTTCRQPCKKTCKSNTLRHGFMKSVLFVLNLGGIFSALQS